MSTETWWWKSKLHRQKKRNSTQHPLGRLLLRFEVEGPHESGTSHLGLVDRTRVHVAQIQTVDRDGLDEDDGNGWCQFLQLRLLNRS